MEWGRVMPISARILIENLIAEYCSLPEDESAYYDLCEKAEKIVAEYGAETIFDGCIAYLSGAQITAENVFPFAYMFFALGLQDFLYSNPYRLVALLYHKVQGTVDQDNILWSVSAALAQKSGGYKGYIDAYEPLEDKKVLEELHKIKG